MRFSSPLCPLAVFQLAGHERLESRTILAREVWDESAVAPKEHFGAHVTELPRNPLRALAGGKPEGRRGVACLIRPAFLQPEVTEDGVLNHGRRFSITV